MTNPNVYNGTDSLKEEHVYDEIKHKEGYKDPGKTSDFQETTFVTLLYMHLTYMVYIPICNAHICHKIVKIYSKILFPEGKQ